MDENRTVLAFDWVTHCNFFSCVEQAEMLGDFFHRKLKDSIGDSSDRDDVGMNSETRLSINLNLPPPSLPTFHLFPEQVQIWIWRTLSKKIRRKDARKSPMDFLLRTVFLLCLRRLVDNGQRSTCTFVLTREKWEDIGHRKRGAFVSSPKTFYNIVVLTVALYFLYQVFCFMLNFIRDI